jgi:hypothetical protein
MVKPCIRLALGRRSLILRHTSRAYSANSKKEPISDNEVIKLNVSSQSRSFSLAELSVRNY